MNLSGQMKSKKHVQWMRQPKSRNVRFSIPFNKLFGVSVTQGKCMLAKRSAAGKD